jgi:hypothetical protein
MNSRRFIGLTQTQEPCRVYQVTAVHRSKTGLLMSGLGHKRTFGDACSMSGLPQKADIDQREGRLPNRTKHAETEFGFRVTEFGHRSPCTE